MANPAVPGDQPRRFKVTGYLVDAEDGTLTLSMLTAGVSRGAECAPPVGCRYCIPCSNRSASDDSID